jgi:hypothetical protein
LRHTVTIRLASLLLWWTALAQAVIIDRIAVSVGNRVITVGDIEREIRVTAFLNGVQPNLAPAARRATADRMVEQRLIRNELETSRYPIPGAAEVDRVLEEFRKAHFPNTVDYNQALAKAGVTEKEVTDELLWQRTLLRFIEVRFRSAVQITDQEIEDYFAKVVEPAAKSARPGLPVSLEDFRSQIDKTLTGQREDRQVDQWLVEARRQTPIVYHEEVFR